MKRLGMVVAVLVLAASVAGCRPGIPGEKPLLLPDNVCSVARTAA